ncbi:hypothetical protein [Afifella marina]|uniref:Uncharacterized protein n=1 Tax=Afifella marina DSM 2698 TaxID=1120955 RepID=A0A1G5N9K3_AFIMA|nr:hypothetical protein [Afifella marina]MBK1623096.1 hypothetical protein [Afifella marina DSM 2698]MBK1626090.1 hypothetical protein [Afifella marina]MBK5916968.1 hypothetical protein [Afifella marina]RAI21971.1 hypothetical protein CH311_04420 [Afifella marina DSM 2698]SCZ34052.1 hypothetical protein SAMN03080610_01627 [Afifella marina DSM 2698]
MNEQRDWSGCLTWHELLDALCARQGYLDNLALADDLCAANGIQTQAAFNATLKNLQNWRRGAHIPQRRNFVLLGKILKVDQFDGLRERWNRLYSEAKTQRTNVSAKNVEVPPSSDPTAIAPAARLSVAIAVAVLVVGSVAAFFVLVWPESDIADTNVVVSPEELRADYVRNVTATVGDALVIHGARGTNCGPAPDWDDAKKKLPELETGILSDGDVGTRFSRQCGRRVPARAILFTATSPGTEQTALFGDRISITVQ